MWVDEPIAIGVMDNTITSLGFQFWDEAADEPLDMTGYALKLNVATADGQALLFSVDFTSGGDLATGMFDVSIDGSSFPDGVGERHFAGQAIATGNGESVTAARFDIIVNEGID